MRMITMTYDNDNNDEILCSNTLGLFGIHYDKGEWRKLAQFHKRTQRHIHVSSKIYVLWVGGTSVAYASVTVE